MRKSTKNLYLLTFLSLLMGFASQVDIGKIATQAVDRHAAASEAFIKGADL